ncbi:MAG TPA: hypothetical protein VFN61_08785 [Acidimicrobiales bacterium]|nr:hypothetical protein [Acidimicrobiales bacterium]
MFPSKAAVTARSAVLLAVTASTTNPVITALCMFGLFHALERYWEVRA